MKKKATKKNKPETEEERIQRKMDSTMKKLYPKGNESAMGHDGCQFDEMVYVQMYLPIGTLVVTPNTMSRKDFNSFRLKWISCMANYFVKQNIEIRKKEKAKRLAKLKK